MKTFKAGLWVGQDPVCSFDSALPKERWPKCASWFLVDANSIAAGKDAEPKDMPIPLLLAEGQPPIVQVLGKADENKPAYFFLALRAEDVAQPNEIAAVTLRWVACGTQSQGDAKKGTAGELVHFPGLDKDCHPLTVDALRAAALATPTKDEMHWAWVRSDDR